MITIQGKGVSKGIARGPLCFFRRREAVVTKKAAGHWEEELARLTAAQTDSAVQLAELAERCRGLEGDAASLFETHAMFVEDEDFTAMLPQLRLAFSYFLPTETDRLARSAAKLHGQSGSITKQRAVDAADYSRAEAVDAWAAAHLEDWGDEYGDL